MVWLVGMVGVVYKLSVSDGVVGRDGRSGI